MPGVESIAMERWSRARGSRLGRWLFSRALGRYAPYTGTIGAQVEQLEPGRSVVTMRDRKAVRNHLNSIHAVALSNLTEVSGSFAIIASMQPDTRMIPVRLETEYVKKARGRLTGMSAIPAVEKAAIPQYRARPYEVMLCLRLQARRNKGRRQTASIM